MEHFVAQSPTERSAVLDLPCQLVKAAGATLFEAGDTTGGAYLICEGLVGLFQETSDGCNVYLGLRRAKVLVGAGDVLYNGRYSATALTLSPCTLRYYDAATFKRLLSTNSSFQNQVLRSQHAELNDIMRELVSLRTQSSRQRLIDLLNIFHQLSRPASDEGNTPFALPFKLGQCAEIVGTSPEHLSRTLAVLIRERVLSRQKGDLFTLHKGL